MSYQEGDFRWEWINIALDKEFTVQCRLVKRFVAESFRQAQPDNYDLIVSNQLSN